MRLDIRSESTDRPAWGATDALLLLGLGLLLVAELVAGAFLTRSDQALRVETSAIHPPAVRAVAIHRLLSRGRLDEQQRRELEESLENAPVELREFAERSFPELAGEFSEAD